jgi:general stress protein 26
VLAHDFEGKVWLFTADPSPKTDEVDGGPRVDIAYADGPSHVSLSGTATVTRDAALVDRFWNPWAESWFEGGRDDPKLALLEVDADSVEYWHVDEPAVLRAFEAAKGLVIGSVPEVGESRTVQL